MKQLILIVATVFSLSACSSAPRADEKQSRTPYVVMVSIDGYRFDYTDRFDPPHLKKLARTGVQAEALIPSYPSKTFPNHWSIITGLYPGHHGIVANEFHDPARDQTFKVGDPSKARNATWYGGIPLWSATEQQGIRAATYFWPGSDADPQSHPPSYRVPFDDSVPADRRLEQVIRWLELPEQDRPHFVTLYFSDVDSAGHKFGPRSEETRKAVLRVDGWIGKLEDRLKNLPFPVNLIIVSDHGMEELNPAKVEYLDDYADLRGALILGRGPQVLIYFKPGEEQKNKTAIYEKLKTGAKHFRVYRREEIPERFHLKDNPRAGDLMIEADAPYWIALRSEKASVPAGNHGYDPKADPNMNGIFYASGPQFQSGLKVQAFQNVDVYPIILNALGLKLMGPIDGKLKPEFMKKARESHASPGLNTE